MPSIGAFPHFPRTPPYLLPNLSPARVFGLRWRFHNGSNGCTVWCFRCCRPRCSTAARQTVKTVGHSIETISIEVAFHSYGDCRTHVGTQNSAISGILVQNTVWRSVTLQDVRQNPSPASTLAKFVNCVQTVRVMVRLPGVAKKHSCWSKGV